MSYPPFRVPFLEQLVSPYGTYVHLESVHLRSTRRHPRTACGQGGQWRYLAHDEKYWRPPCVTCWRALMQHVEFLREVVPEKLYPDV